MQNEKQRAATGSAIAAVGLTAFKLVIGFSTGSLGILAEAAHSGLDLLAAIMTAAAVRFSDLPADESHLYGHGKIENLSALAETILLLLTCVWVVTRAVLRLHAGHVEIQVTFWSFAVMGLSILVDLSRSRILYRTAKKFNSQALEADALHFSTDIWSSGVVIIGLIGVKISQKRPDLWFLAYADAVSAILVGLIVVYVSIRLGYRAIARLVDAAPVGMKELIVKTVSGISGIKGCQKVRLRYSGARLFIDLQVLIDGERKLNEAHDLTNDVERSIRQVVPDADVTVHAEPCDRDMKIGGST